MGCCACVFSFPKHQIVMFLYDFIPSSYLHIVHTFPHLPYSLSCHAPYNRSLYLNTSVIHPDSISLPHPHLSSLCPSLKFQLKHLYSFPFSCSSLHFHSFASSSPILLLLYLDEPTVHSSKLNIMDYMFAALQSGAGLFLFPKHTLFSFFRIIDK